MATGITPFRSHVEWRGFEIADLVDSLRAELRKTDWTRAQFEATTPTYDLDGLLPEGWE